MLALAALLLGAGPAHAGEASRILERCTHGQSLSGFSQNGYREALKQMPTEVSEYTDCPSLIRKAELAAAGGGGGGEGAAGSGSSTPIPLTPAEQKEVVRAHHSGSAPVRLDGTAIRPGVVHANIASVTSTLPSSLLTVLAILLAGALAAAGSEAYRRVRASRNR